ncbi:MAG: hypothetical protein KF749_17005 [Bacteroidetes bacterium]|nr:hypothetical protein [Bacteroidota bacterium]MCW5894109.1 hypothetical protein [Bacteroidota bacterium]
MTHRHTHIVASIGVCLLLSQFCIAQGYDVPLTIQGLDQRTMQSAASRASGGITLGRVNELGLMFANPASLQTLEGFQISLGGVQRHSSMKQIQQYAPLKYYSNFSLLMEGLTHLIPDPRYGDTVIVNGDTTIIRFGGNPGDSVQRPYDSIGPNWSRSKNQALPIQAMIGVPFSIDDMRFTIGIGAIEYANLYNYYQNNNVLSPSILSQRPSPFPLPTNVNTVEARWSQYIRLRDGRMRGYGAALSGSLSDNIHIGFSGMILKGSSDDFEQRNARGRLTFFANFFRLDSVYGQTTKSGTSDYSGQEYTISAMYLGNYVTLGASVKPPTTITRTFSNQVRVDTGGTSSVFTHTGEDKIRLPWRGSVGLSIKMREELLLSFEYEMRSTASAQYSSPDTTYNPWLSSSVFRVGAEYRASDWLTLRAGIRGQAEVFEPEGNPIAGEPVVYSVYSTGLGFAFGPARLNIAYEYGLMKYQDVWGSNVNLNSEGRHAISADVAYVFPW